MKNLKEIVSWCLFDFANSSYSAVIAAVVFPVYFADVLVGNKEGLGDLWWGRVISISMLFVAITSPFLGGIADYARVRKKLLVIYTLLSVVAIFCFSFLKKGMVYEGVILAILANIGMEGGVVFYNAFLPDIAEKRMYGRVSSFGFGVGYGGSVISLLVTLFIIKNSNIKYVWLFVSLFFLLFSLPAFLFLPKDGCPKEGFLSSGRNGVRWTLKTFKDIIKTKNIRKFLVAYFFYEDGINTVIVFSSIFAATTLKFTKEELIFLYLAVQLVALLGSFIMAKGIDTFGAKGIIEFMLLLWIFVTTSSFFVVEKKTYCVIAGMAGFGLGVTQAASRALFAKFIPHGRENDYFGIYALVGKTSAVLGPLVFGFLSSTMKSQRPAVLSISIFFLIGYFLMYSVKEVKDKDGEFMAIEDVS